MTKERISIRATTKVVRQPKQELPWTLERARLARIHSAALNSAQTEANVRADLARKNGRREGREDIVKSMLAEVGFREHFFRAAAKELGREAGRHIDDWARREIDPALLASRKRITDHMINLAHLSARFDETPASEPMVMASVEFQPHHFVLAQILPRY